MSEEAPENYNTGDIVWVKLGSCWWPGLVKDLDELPNEFLDFKKPPLVIVKFFEEDSYEYVRSWSNIYPYNSDKKNEFIKKGMAAFRANVSHMEKFPKDVITAEVKIGGNPNILSEPMFLPEKKRNYAAEVFGTPSPKSKGNKDKKSRPSNKSSNQKDTHITHRRFLGVDDYRAYICIQYPGKDRVPGDKEDEEVLRINSEPEQEFNCHSCSFTTKRLEVMILHTKSHIRGVCVSSPRRNKPSVRKKKEKSKKSRGSDVIELESSSSDSEPIRERKRKPRPHSAKKSKVKKEEPKPVIDIRSELLAVWDDSDEDEEFDLPLSKSTESEQTLSQSITNIILGEITDKLTESTGGKPKETGEAVNEKSDEPMDETLNESADSTLDKLEVLNQTDDKEVDVRVEVTETSEKTSDENFEKPPSLSTEVLTPPLDEAVNQLETVDKSNDEPYQPELPNRAVSKQLDESVEERVNHSKVDDQSAESIKSNDGVMQSNIESTYKIPEKLKSTSDNKEPLEDDIKEKDTEQSKQKMDQDIQAAIKSCFDFDEDDEEDSTILSKATVGRKIPRVIPPAERRKSHEIAEEGVNPDLILKESDTFNKKTEESSSEDVDAAFKELMEMTTVPELPDVQNTLKCEQNFHNIKTIKFPDKLDPIGSGPPKVAMIEKKEPSEIATKLTNPKKRFVKSFEDFELMQNEIRRKEEQVDVVKGESKLDLPEINSDTISRFDDVVSPLDEMSLDFSVRLAKLKSTIMSTLIEEANINEESKKKIMSKIQDPESLKVKEANTATSFSHSNKDTTVEKAGSSISHRTPRSKILELYRNDKNKHKVEEEEQKIEKVVTQVSVEPKIDTAFSNKREIMNDRVIDFLTQSEILPPKKNKWSRRGSHPKKDKSLFLLGDTATEEPPFKQSESDTKTDNLPKVDSQTPLETSSLNSVPSSSSSTVVIKEIEPPTTDENVTAVSEIIEEQKTEKVLTAEENIEVKEDSVTDIASRTEEAHKLPLVDEDMPLKDKEGDKVLLTEGEVDTATVHIGQTIDKPYPQDGTPVSIANDEAGKVTLPQTENNILPSNEVALGSLLSENEKEKLPEILSNQEIARNEVKEEKENIRLDTKEVEEDALPKDPVISADCLMGTESSAEKDNLLSKNVSLPAEKCVLSPERDMEDNTLNSNVTVEADQNVSTEVAEVPPLNSDVFPTVEGTIVSAVKDVISSPPKKSKKRKISDSYLSSFEGSDTSKEVSKPEFSPAEKKKREAEVEVDTNMEICPIPETEVELKDIEPSKSECKPELPHTEVNNTDTYQESLFEKTEEVMSDSAEELTRVMDHKNEVEIQCASSSPDSFKFSIQTNLSNLTSREEISALALATLSEIKADLENSNSNVSEEKVEEPEKTVVPPVPADSELVPIEGNLTVVSEKDLADGQVEITTQQVISPKKPLTLSNFSMDFSDSASDSNSTSDTFCDFGKCTDFSARGTEFTSKAITNITKQIKKVDRKKENAYERLELLNILEGNSDTEKKPKDYPQPSKSVVDDICDFEEHIPSQIVCAKTLKREGAVGAEYPFMEKEKIDKLPEKSIASKLLERLTEPKERTIPSKTNTQGDAKSLETTNKPSTKRQSVTPSSTRSSKYLRAKPATTTGKPVILSEQIVKRATETVKLNPKKLLNDIEDVEAFVIHKDPKKRQLEQENSDSLQSKSAAGKHAGKAKILQQTIITPAGEIIQPTVQQAQTDDNIFDINSMPIVLSDEILTPESIENMPIMIGTETKSEDQDKTLKRSPQSRIITKTTVAVPQPITNKTITISKHSKQPRILQTVGNRVIKNSPLLPSTAKPGKYIIVPQSGIQPAKYISKKAPIVKRSPIGTSIVSKIPTISPEPSGNKIMIVTNQQGQQQRLLLTPAQQKMLGYQNQKVTKTVVKGNMMQKSVLATKTVPLVEAGTSGIVSKGPSIVGQKVVIGTSSNTGIISTTSSQIISNQGKNVKGMPKKLQPVNQKTTGKTQKTILIKNQHGQTVRKIQGTDDELLDKQVAEQLEAIKASAGIKFSSQSKPIEQPYKTTPKTTVRRSYAKKLEAKPKVGPPPLSSIQLSSKSETVAFPVAKKAEPTESKPPALVTEEAKPQLDRPLNQLVIQDAVGNQTTITEGQILALPSETVDGQPQSYMLVTLDESGNLTPLNSEALMSLDPNLGLGGDLSNMVLQIDQGALTERPQTIALKASLGNESAKLVEMETPATVGVPEASITTEIAETVVDQKIVPVAEAAQTIPPSTNGDPGQQLIVTGDPIATQKFLESLTEGTTDLANILANAEGNSILIQADGQQILINTNSDNQMLLSVNNDNVNVSESSEGGGNPIFATQPSKNQDILAAALADTDVFQQEQHASQGKITSQLSPSNALYPMNVGNVLETSLTLSSPIMTPLEVPSTNNKKIPDDEADILTQVPKNVDLPITITDPNISQTVANQQVASLIANELQTNLELALPISETTISSVSTEMNSPSYVYSLPTLDESVDINQKPFNSNMPLLNEDIDESANKVKVDTESKIGEEETKQQNHNKPQNVINSRGSFLEEEEGRFTLGGEMCSSLSEPPPEMFDLPEDDPTLAEKRRPNIPSSLQSTPDVSDNASKDDDTTDLSTQAETSSEGSCEIPLQPQIVTKSLDLSSSLDPLKRSLEESEEEDSKKCKFD